MAYVFICSMVVGLISNPSLPLTELQFGFGRELERIISGEPMRDPSRLPLVPYLLAALYSISDKQMMAIVVKNFLIQPLLLYVLLYWWIRCAYSVQAVALIIFVLVFPQVWRHGFSLIPEEGYLIAALAFVFHGLLVSPGFGRVSAFVPYAIVTALLFLIKGSMLIVAPTLIALYFYRTRDVRVFFLFGVAFTAAMMTWGFMTFNGTGKFALSTTLSGYEIWKGNNPRTIDYFPHHTLDILSGEVPQRRAGESPWDWSHRLQQEALEFVLSEPLVATKLLNLKFYQVFVSITAESSPSWSSSQFGFLRPWLKGVGVIFMCAFRLLFFASLIVAIAAIACKPAGSDERTAAVCYLVFVFAFSFPFLVAWGTERRIMPMVIPTVLYLLFALEHGTLRPPSDSRFLVQG